MIAILLKKNVWEYTNKESKTLNKLLVKGDINEQKSGRVGEDNNRFTYKLC